MIYIGIDPALMGKRRSSAARAAICEPTGDEKNGSLLMKF